MTIDEFCEVLDGFTRVTGIPYRHYVYSKPTPAPCLVYYEMDGEDVQADGINVLDDVYIRAELYVRPTDSASGAAFEELLTANGLSYDRERAWVDERGEVVIYYDITI
ncbi:MAG: hypothetical protein IJG87_03710 [Ruminococcus sp.]|nr:hypothetical protein [Ruminococcus sp.]